MVKMTNFELASVGLGKVKLSLTRVKLDSFL